MMRPIELKRATEEDAVRAFGLFRRLQADEGVPGTFRLDEAGFREFWLGTLQTEIMFAVSDGSDVGFCGCVRDWFIPGLEDALYMSAIYVVPDCRRHGVGRLLVGELRRRAWSLGRTRLVWCVQADNVPAHRFGAAVGASKVGERQVEEQDVMVELHLFALSAEPAPR